MHSRSQTWLSVFNPRTERLCLACGDRLPSRRHRYCSPACRQQLLASLNRRTGLLRALNTRYATFSFSDYVIMMDLLPYGIERIYTYILPRTPGKKPVEDFCSLCNMLGTAWWNERNRTHKRYLASRHVLEQADNSDKDPESLVPRTTFRPAVRSDSLIRLEIKVNELTRTNSEACIKQAFRRQAKKHHPDLGGNPQTFRKIHEAYQKLIQWAKHPTFTHRSGFPGKWLYEGGNCRWTQPITRTRKKT